MFAHTKINCSSPREINYIYREALEKLLDSTGCYKTMTFHYSLSVYWSTQSVRDGNLNIELTFIHLDGWSSVINIISRFAMEY